MANYKLIIITNSSTTSDITTTIEKGLSMSKLITFFVFQFSFSSHHCLHFHLANIYIYISI